MTGIAKEYAAALFMLAGETGAEENWLSALDTVSALLEENGAYVEFLASPGIPKAERTEALSQAFGDTLPEYVLSFLQLLCEQGAIKEYGECVGLYNALYAEHNRHTTAAVTSAAPLDDAQRTALVKKLEKLCGRNVTLDCKIDKSVLGGLVIELDGKIIDGSLKNKLHKVKEVIDK
jgi:F-type H+-transporting ATPase subunit delta